MLRREATAPALGPVEESDTPERGPGPPGRAAWDTLFEHFFAGDAEEAAAAAGTFARMIRFWMLRLGVHDGELSSDDLVQDVLLELTRSRPGILDPGALGGWLRTTTVRKVQDRWRGARRGPRWQSSEPLESLPAPVLLPDEQVLRKQDHADLLAAIDRLPPRLRACIHLQLRGLSESEIARELQARHPAGPSVQLHSVKNWLRKARSELRHSLLERPS